jgi:hypothetical protein
MPRQQRSRPKPPQALTPARSPGVTGTIQRTWQDNRATYLDFGGAFYLVSCDLDLTTIQRGTCVIEA